MKSTLTELVFIIDRSGSMSGLENDTIGGFNSMLKKQQNESGECRITTVLFDNYYEILHDRIDIKAVSMLSDKDYFVRGQTALLDAIGKTINDVGKRLNETQEEKRPGKVIFVITTDGLENASHLFSYKDIKNMITHQTDRYNWEFIFMGANIDFAQEGCKLGINPSLSHGFTGSSDGIRHMFSNVASFCDVLRTEKSNKKKGVTA